MKQHKKTLLAGGIVLLLAGLAFSFLHRSPPKQIQTRQTITNVIVASSPETIAEQKKSSPSVEPPLPYADDSEPAANGLGVGRNWKSR